MLRLTNNYTRASKSLEISSWNVNGLFKTINNQKISKRSNQDFVRPQTSLYYAKLILAQMKHYNSMTTNALPIADIAKEAD